MNKIAVEPTNLVFLSIRLVLSKLNFPAPVLLRPYITISLSRCLAATWPVSPTPKLPCLQRGISIAVNLCYEVHPL